MPIIKSAIKRMHQTTKRRERNVAVKKDIKQAVKAFVAKPTADTLSKAQSELDKAVKKGLIKKNTAARRKMALSKVAKDAGVKLAATKKPAAAKTTAKPAAKTTAKTTAKATTKPATKAPAKKPVAKVATKPSTTKTTVKKPAAKKTATKATATKAPAKKPAATKKADK